MGKRIAISVAASLALVLVAEVGWSQPPGGFRGGPGGGFRGGPPGGFRGGPGRPSRFSPDAMWERLSGGKSTIDLKSVSPFIRPRLEEYAKQKGITNGRITKEQFVDFLKQMRERMEKRRREWEEKRKSSSGSSSGSGDRSRWSRSRTPPSKEELEKRIKESTDSYFKGRDRNKDGYLDKKEMSDRLRSRLKEYDKNGDGKISYEESKAYIRGFWERRLGISRGDSRKSSSSSSRRTKVDLDILEKRPVVYRAGHLPEELKGTWFGELDHDNDGQVAMYEWRGAGKDLAEFEEKYDRNRDGFITPEEMLFYLKYVAADKKSDSSGGNGGSSTQSPGTSSIRSRTNGFRSGGGSSERSGSDRSRFGRRFGRRGG